MAGRGVHIGTFHSRSVPVTPIRGMHSVQSENCPKRINRVRVDRTYTVFSNCGTEGRYLGKVSIFQITLRLYGHLYKRE